MDLHYFKDLTILIFTLNVSNVQLGDRLSGKSAQYLKRIGQDLSRHIVAIFLHNQIGLPVRSDIYIDFIRNIEAPKFYEYSVYGSPARGQYLRGAIRRSP